MTTVARRCSPTIGRRSIRAAIDASEWTEDGVDPAVVAMSPPSVDVDPTLGSAFRRSNS